LFAGAVAVALLGSVAAIGVPAGWYSGKAAAVVAEAPAVTVHVSQPEVSPSPESVAVESPATSAAPEDAAALAARKQRERDRAKAREEKAALSATISPAAAANSSGPKRVSVTVTYDESGRVVQASGGDASALRIARQKRFPPGKAGSATVTIPIN
jgi:hypothetical protein